MNNIKEVPERLLKYAERDLISRPNGIVKLQDLDDVRIAYGPSTGFEPILVLDCIPGPLPPGLVASLKRAEQEQQDTPPASQKQRLLDPDAARSEEVLSQASAGQKFVFEGIKIPEDLEAPIDQVAMDQDEEQPEESATSLENGNISNNGEAQGNPSIPSIDPFLIDAWPKFLWTTRRLSFFNLPVQEVVSRGLGGSIVYLVRSTPRLKDNIPLEMASSLARRLGCALVVVALVSSEAYEAVVGPTALALPLGTNTAPAAAALDASVSGAETRTAATGQVDIDSSTGVHMPQSPPTPHPSPDRRALGSSRIGKSGHGDDSSQHQQQQQQQLPARRFICGLVALASMGVELAAKGITMLGLVIGPNTARSPSSTSSQLPPPLPTQAAAPPPSIDWTGRCVTAFNALCPQLPGGGVALLFTDDVCHPSSAILTNALVNRSVSAAGLGATGNKPQGPLASCPVVVIDSNSFCVWAPPSGLGPGSVAGPGGGGQASAASSAPASGLASGAAAADVEGQAQSLADRFDAAVRQLPLQEWSRPGLGPVPASTPFLAGAGPCAGTGGTETGHQAWAQNVDDTLGASLRSAGAGLADWREVLRRARAFGCSGQSANRAAPAPTQASVAATATVASGGIRAKPGAATPAAAAAAARAGAGRRGDKPLSSSHALLFGEIRLRSPGVKDLSHKGGDTSIAGLRSVGLPLTEPRALQLLADVIAGCDGACAGAGPGTLSEDVSALLLAVDAGLLSPVSLYLALTSRGRSNSSSSSRSTVHAARHGLWLALRPLLMERDAARGWGAFLSQRSNNLSLGQGPGHRHDQDCTWKTLWLLLRQAYCPATTGPGPGSAEALPHGPLPEPAPIPSLNSKAPVPSQPTPPFPFFEPPPHFLSGRSADPLFNALQRRILVQGLAPCYGLQCLYWVCSFLASQPGPELGLQAALLEVVRHGALGGAGLGGGGGTEQAAGIVPIMVAAAQLIAWHESLTAAMTTSSSPIMGQLAPSTSSFPATVWVVTETQKTRTANQAPGPGQEQCLSQEQRVWSALLRRIEAALRREEGGLEVDRLIDRY